MRGRYLAVVLAGAILAGSLPAPDVSAAGGQFAGEEWYDQIETVEVNREPAHASFIPYETSEKALANEKSALDALDETDSLYYQSLNGEWKFYWSKNPANRLKRLFGSAAAGYTENWNTAGWDTIQVPSNIQTRKNADGSYRYDKPIYTNQKYPWANYETVDYNGGEPSAPTVTNSVGHYKRTFTLPDSWDGRQVFVSFQGVESAFYLYVNGKRVGYGEDSYTADDFNITSYLKAGENTIAAEVYRWSDGSYLENQDFIRLSGIFRDVYLYAKDDVALRDIFVTTDLNSDYTQANVNLSVDVKNLAASSGTYTVEAQLYDAADNAVWSTPISVSKQVSASKSSTESKADDTGTTFTGAKAVNGPKLWFADSPYLYRLLVQLKDRSGNVLENACVRVGMREIDTVSVNSNGQQQIRINGKKIMLRGTNRHETDAEDGRALTKEDILTDIQMMKSFNINAIRTAHYPNNTYLYDLADELGLYVCDEANIESHMGAIYSTIPSGSPIWNISVMDRTKNMVERDKNHASVVIWSLGNEATYSTYTMNDSYCFYNSTRWILERDPSRIRKYERDNRYTSGNRAQSMVDVYSSQYWGVDYVLSHLKNTSNKLPYIQSEYAHSMGNGLGNLAEYWELFRTYDNANGGFIWDWMDQALHDTKNGQQYFAYGGDWGETVTDNDFCANGMVNADRTPSPELYEAKKVLQEISFYDEDIENGKVRIVNEFLNTNLDQFRVLWTYAKDNKTLAGGELTGSDIDIAAGASKTVQVKLPSVEIVSGSDYVLTFSVVRREDTAWANCYGGKAGDEIAFEQFELNPAATKEQPSMDITGMDDLTAENTGSQLTFSGITEDGDPFRIVISKETGYITQYQVAGKDLLTAGPVPNYWRAPTSNDAGAGVSGAGSNLKNAADYFRVNQSDIVVDVNDKVVTVTVPGEITSVRSKNTLTYAVYANGMVTVTNTFTPSSSCDTIARVGMKMNVAAGLEQVTYYGKGEQENYTDRSTGAKLGVYSTTVTDLFESKYVKPQENGNRTGTRWVSLMDDEAQLGLLVTAEDTMEFSALHYTAEELAGKRHPYELNALEETVLTVDYAQRGLGNASCGPDTLAKYQLPAGKTYTHTYSLRPLSGKRSADADFADICMERSSQNINASMPVSGITVDGAPLEDFAADTASYTYERLYQDGMGNPVVDVIKTSPDVQVEIQQISGANGTAVVTATSPYGVSATYYVTVSTVKREYLSDMEWTKNESGYFENGRDVCGANPIQLSVNGVPVTYKKGVGMHAPASISVNIAQKGYTRFVAEAGINYNQVASNNGNSNVNLVVLVDGAEAFRKNNVGYNNGRNVFSVPIDVDVTGARTVTVKVETGANNDYNDHVSWADAKFIAVMGDTDDTALSIAAAQNISTATLAGELPELPETVNGLLAAGDIAGQYPVKWDNMRAGQFDIVGEIVTVNGTVTIKDGVTMPVTASVRVAEKTATETENLAPLAEVTQNIAASYQSDNLASIVNGRTKPGNNAQERWTNYNNRTNSDSAALTFTWDGLYSLTSVDLYYYLDNYSAYLPSNVKIEYTTNGSTWKELSVSAKEVEIYDLGAQYRYSFSEVQAKALRVTLKQQGGTTSYKCVGLTEAEISGHSTELSYHTSAALSDIQVDGASVGGFMKDTLKYTASGKTVTAQGEDNAAVTILPVYGGVVRVITLSEDQNSTRTYAVTLTDAPACTHENTEVRNASEASCTQNGYTGDLYCSDCGVLIKQGKTIPKTGHHTVLINEKEAACTEKGYTGDVVCTACHTVITPGAEIPAKGHTWDAGVVTKEPTETETGTKTYTCTVCGAVRAETIPAAGTQTELKMPSPELTVTRGADSKMTLTGTFRDYENAGDYYEVTDHGFVYYPTAKLGRRTLTVNTPGRTRVNFSKYNEDGTFVYDMNPVNGNTQYTIRAFFSCRDKQGKTVYVYSDPIAASFNMLPR